MEEHCSTGQSPQWTVVPIEEEEEEDDDDDDDKVQACLRISSASVVR